MKPYKFLGIGLLASLLLIGCKNDDDTINPQDPEPTLEELQDISLQILTGGAEKTWYITNASLVNDNGTFNITNNFNVQDDDFVFNTDGTLIWNQGFDINADATSPQTASIDYYLGPIETNYAFLAESSTQIEASNGRINVEVVDEENLTAAITFEGRMPGGTLNLNLQQRTPGTYPSPPTNGLNFSLVTTNQNGGNIFGDGTAGFIGSYSDNSLFVVSRDDFQSNGTTSPEQILKYSISNNQWTENLFFQADFVTKRLNIINNELVAFGGFNVNNYPLTPNGDATATFEHGIGLTRFGFTVQNDFAYVIGNNVDQTAQPATVNRYNYLTNAITTVATLPKARVYAGAEVVNETLYVFGGRDDFLSENLDAECFAVNLNTNQITSFNMPDAPTMSFAAKNQNLIYVGYETRTEAGDPGINDDDRTINFAVYNTLDGSFTSLSHNLDDSDIASSIHGITIFNGSLYVIYGGADSQAPFEFSIYSAPLN